MKTKKEEMIIKEMYLKVLGRYRNITASLPNNFEMFYDIQTLLRYIGHLEQELGEAKSLGIAEHSTVILESFDMSGFVEQ